VHTQGSKLLTGTTALFNEPASNPHQKITAKQLTTQLAPRSTYGTPRHMRKRTGISSCRTMSGKGTCALSRPNDRSGKNLFGLRHFWCQPGLPRTGSHLELQSTSEPTATAASRRDSTRLISFRATARLTASRRREVDAKSKASAAFHTRHLYSTSIAATASRAL